jgi:hypothetical protein
MAKQENEDDIEDEPEVELFDIEVDTVGLVEAGAVGEDFFLLKGDGAMADEDRTEEEPTLKSFFERLGEKRFMQIFQKAEKEMIEGEEVTQNPPEKGKEVELMADKEEKIEEQEQVDVSAELNKAIEEAQTELEKTFKAKEEELTKAFEAKSEALAKALEDAETDAGEFRTLAARERETRQRREFIEKAKAYDSLPIASDELGDYLYELSKWDEGANVELAKSEDHKEEDNQDRLGWLESVLKATNEQIKESKFYVEAGSSHIPDSGGDDLVALAKEIQKETPELNLAEAMLKIPTDVAIKKRNK